MVSTKRERYLEREEMQANRELEQLTRRWPSDPTVIGVLFAVALIIVLFLWL